MLLLGLLLLNILGESPNLGVGKTVCEGIASNQIHSYPPRSSQLVSPKPLSITSASSNRSLQASVKGVFLCPVKLEHILIYHYAGVVTMRG